MVVQEEQDRVRHLLTQALPLLCKNGLSFSSEFSVEALIGITLDKNDVFLVSIKETFTQDCNQGSDSTIDVSVKQIVNSNESTTPNTAKTKPNRKRRRSRSSRSPDSDSENEQVIGIESIKHERTSDSEMVDNSLEDSEQGTSDLQAEDSVNNEAPDTIIVKQEPTEYGIGFGSITHASGSHGLDLSHTSTENSAHSLGTQQALTSTSHQPLQESDKATTPDSPNPLEVANFDESVEEIDKEEEADVKKDDPTDDYIAVHTEGLLWMCVICSKLCNQRQNLKRHINGVHLKTQRFACKYCGKDFIYQDSKIRHERKCHNNTSPVTQKAVVVQKKAKSSKTSGRFYGNQYVASGSALGESAMPLIDPSSVQKIIGKSVKHIYRQELSNSLALMQRGEENDIDGTNYMDSDSIL